MAHGLKSLAVWGLACFAVANSNANTIVFEPDDFAPGTYVSRAISDVTLWTFRSYGDTGYVPTFSPVYVAEDPRCTTHPDDCAATTGTNVFEDAYGGRTAWGAIGGAIVDPVYCFQSLGQGTSDGPFNPCGQRFNVMLMEFTSLTSFVQISGAYAVDDQTVLYAFDDSFNLVGVDYGWDTVEWARCHEDGGNYCRAAPSIHLESESIRYVIAGGWSNGTSLDALTFSVPEPGTLALLGFGLAGLGLSRRRKAH